jgi:glutathione S-transferase
MIIVHHLNNSRSQRVLWLLEELGVPSEIKFYQRNPQTMLAPPELRAVHPLGKSPVITDGTRSVAESGAILEYLLDQYGNGRLRPAPDTEGFLRYRYFLHYAEGSLMPPMLLALVFARMPKAPMPFFVRPLVRGIAKGALTTFVQPQIKTHLDYLEGELSQNAWFAGLEFSAADIQLSFPLQGAAARGGLDKRWPKLGAFLERITERPAYQRALTKGGPLELLR